MQRKQKRILVFSILLGVLFIVGISFAYWMLTSNQINPNQASTACLNVTLTDVTSAIKLEDTYPISDEEGMATTPYTFTIQNTCDTFISYEVLLGVMNTSTLSSEYVAAVLDYNQIKTLNNYETKTIDGYKEGYILQKGNLSANEEITYNFRMWMDYDTPLLPSTQNQTYETKIVVEASLGTYNPVEQGFKTLADAMLVNEYQSLSVEDAKARIESKQDPDFSETAPIIEWVENHASNTTETTATMPHPDLLNVEEDYTANLTAENILPVIGTSYTFDSEKGQYTIENPQYLDPTTLDYNSDTTYYFCSAGFNTNSNDLITLYQNTSCTTMYRIISATSSDGTTTGTGGTQFDNRTYRMTVYAYTQSEQESDKSDRGLYMMEDQGGKSYYYRGSVSNNYVQFAGYYWRIIRQNGDGSVRLLYAGTTPNATGTGLQIGANVFNSTRTNPGYVGYMYGSTFDTSYAQTHANENDSSIKTVLDNWYKTNIVDKRLSDYIADPGFCNDRSVDSGDGVSTITTTHFGGYGRYVNHNPTLVCPNASNDLFTVDNEDGNQALTYPIGLITVDELMLGGLSDGYLNRLSYTYSSAHYWTMSPSLFGASAVAAREFRAYSTGNAGYNTVTANYGVRPVINLASDVEIESGIGTQNDPYVVKVV